MAINVLVRGQSNALLFEQHGGADVLRADLEARLGQPVNLVAGDGETLFSATRFMDWDTDGQQRALLRAVEAAPDADATAVVWLHNEYDQQGSFSAAEWEAEVRADAALVRGALGQGAAEVPYIFTPVKYPYGGNWGAIEEGMEALDADASFNASISWDAQSLRMDGGPEPGAGSSHMGWQDAQDLGHALVDDVAAALDGSVPAPAPAPSGPQPVPADGGAFDTVMADDFSGGYKTENWGQPFHGGVYHNGAWSWDAGDVNVRDGVMDVTMTRHEDGWWTGGGFNSFKAGNTITYGKFEFDGRVDEAKGTMGVFLTWPATDNWPVDGEIDILETPGGEVMHTTHWQDAGSGEHWYDAVRNEAYDETRWQHYDVLWLPDYLGIKVGDQVVAEWTDPAEIPDVAHGLGAMGNVAGPNDGWMGPPPDGSTPAVVRAQMDNVVMRQWNGGEVDVAAWKAGAAAPAPAPAPVPPPASGPVVLTGERNSPDTFAFRAGEAEARGASWAVDGFEAGFDKLDVEPHTVDGWTYEPWAEDTAEGTVVRYSWDANEGVLLRGVHGATLDGLENPAFFEEEPPVEEPPTDPVDPVDPVEPAEPAPSEFVEVSGGGGRDTLRLHGAFSFRVDGGAGKDVVVLGSEHAASVVVMAAGEAKGDLVLGFEPGMDSLEFRGFGEGAKLEALGDERFRVSGADAKAETFVLAGVEQLDPADYLFA